MNNNSIQHTPPSNMGYLPPVKNEVRKESEENNQVRDEFKPSSEDNTCRKMDQNFLMTFDKPVEKVFEKEHSIYQSSGNEGEITLIFTNDMHGKLEDKGGRGGMANLAGKINDLKKKSEGAHLLLDVGDIAYNPAYSDRNRFNPMVDIMNQIGYDAMAAGNHEFQWEASKYGGPDGNPNPSLTDNLKELQEHTKFPVLCANAVTARDGLRPDFLKPYVIQEVDGVNVGVIGLVTKKMATSAHPLVADGWRVEDQSEVLNKMIPQMKKEGAEIIVVAIHDSLGRNEAMIQNTRGIDIVLGGHDHQFLEDPRMVRDKDGKQVLLVEAGSHTMAVGELKVELDRDSNKISKMTSVLHPVSSSGTKADPVVQDIVNKWKGK